MSHIKCLEFISPRALLLLVRDSSGDIHIICRAYLLIPNKFIKHLHFNSALCIINIIPPKNRWGIYAIWGGSLSISFPQVLNFRLNTSNQQISWFVRISSICKWKACEFPKYWQTLTISHCWNAETVFYWNKSMLCVVKEEILFAMNRKVLTIKTRWKTL